MKNKDKHWLRHAKAWLYYRVRPWFHLSFNETLTLLIAALGFWYVVKSLRSTEHDVSKGTYLQTYGWTLGSDKLMVEHPELRPYFYDSLTNVPKGKDSIKIDAMAEYLLDDFDAILNNDSYFKIDPAAGNDWKKTVVRYFQYSAALRKRFECDSLLYGDTLRAVYYRAFPR